MKNEIASEKMSKRQKGQQNVKKVKRIKNVKKKGKIKLNTSAIDFHAITRLAKLVANAVVKLQTERACPGGEVWKQDARRV